MKLVIGLMLFCISMSAGAQDLNLANQYFKNKDYKNADIEFVKLIKLNNTNQLAWFNLAQSKYQQKDFILAANYFSNVIKLKSNYSAAALYYKALSQLNLNQTTEAVATAKSIQASDVVFFEQAQALVQQINLGYDEALTNAKASLENEEYEDCLTEIAESNFSDTLSGQKIKTDCEAQLKIENESDAIEGDAINSAPAANYKFDAYADINIGSSNNVYQEATATTAKVNYSASLGAEYMLKNVINYGVGFNYDYSNVQDLSSLQENDINFYIPIESDSENFYFRIDPYMASSKSNGVSSYNTGGIEAYYAYYLNQYTLGLSIDINKKTSASSTYDYIAGNYQTLKLLAKYRNGDFKTEAYIGAANNASGDLAVTGGTLPYANKSVLAGIDFGYKINDKYKASFKYSLSGKNYTNIYSTNLTKRVDVATSVNIKLDYTINDNFKLYIQDVYLINKSTYGALEVSNKNYNENNLYLGLAWSL